MCCAIVVCSLSQEYCLTLLVSWETQRLRVQWCATIPHCAPLERGDWRCRAAIDISLLWSEMRDNLRQGIHRIGLVSSPNTLMCCAIVVCSLSQEYCLTLLVSWETQRLRVQWCATIPHCAPLERGDWRCRAAIDIYRSSGAKGRRSLLRSIRRIRDSDKGHMSPGYKHAAPLGL